MRFGTDPASSVLDTNCKAHQLDNLYVTDAGFFLDRRGQPDLDDYRQRAAGGRSPQGAARRLIGLGSEHEHERAGHGGARDRHPRVAEV